MGSSRIALSRDDVAPIVNEGGVLIWRPLDCPVKFPEPTSLMNVRNSGPRAKSRILIYLN